MNVPLPAPLQCFNFNKFRSVAMFSHSFGDKLFLQTRSSFLHSLILFLHLILGGLLAVQFFLPVYLEFHENIVVVRLLSSLLLPSPSLQCFTSFVSFWPLTFQFPLLSRSSSSCGNGRLSVTVSRHLEGLFGDENVRKSISIYL